jgi:predicted dehydrogenase
MHIDRVILVGCGAVSELMYAPTIKRLFAKGAIGDVVLIDRSPARVRAIGRMLPFASRHSDLAALDGALDRTLAIVALPNDLHAPVSIQMLAAGAHVLCEKPMARTTDECDRMLDAAAASGRLIAVGHFRRFYPATKLIRAWIDEERLGRLRSFRFLEGWLYGWPAASTSFVDREAAGGGVLIDAGVHLLDLLLWWMGPVEHLEYWDDAAGGVETNCVLKVRMPSGVTGYVQMSRDWALANQYLFDFERGWLIYSCDVVDRFRWGWHGDRLAQWGVIEGGVSVGFDGLPRSGPVPSTRMECFELQLANVGAAMQGAEALVCPAREARDAVALIEACYRTRRGLPQAWLSPREQAKLEMLYRQRA